MILGRPLLFVQHGWMVVNAGRALGRQGSGFSGLGLGFQRVEPWVLAALWDAEIGGVMGKWARLGVA